jgi:fumarylacetoacetase
MLRSFIEVGDGCHFPIQNLPYGVFSQPDTSHRIGVAIGEFVLDLTTLQQKGLIEGTYFQSSNLNTFISTGKSEWSRVRQRVQHLLNRENPTLRDNSELRTLVLVPRDRIKMHLPVEIGDYTDFYSSREHASNVGAMFRDPQNPLLPNWLHLPVAYHGRASSVVVSGTSIRRPLGQSKPDNAPLPIFGPSRFLDFELEVGYIVGKGNNLGDPIPVDSAAEHIFGMVLVNDWSARDIQSWEYVPLGPFLGKNFGTSISPWVVTMEALEEFRIPGPIQDPPPLPYLSSQLPWSYNLNLEVYLTTNTSQEKNLISKGNFSSMYWNLSQQVAHHTSNGCNLRVGDLLASGTISGKDPDSYGSMLELTWRGAKPLRLKSGEERSSLLDGDTVSMTGYSLGTGYTIGFGEVTGTIEPAKIR